MDRVRKGLGLTFREMDSLAGLGKGVAFHQIRSGGERVPFVTVVAIAESLGIDPMWLGSGKGKEPDLKNVWRTIAPKLTNNINTNIA